MTSFADTIPLLETELRKGKNYVKLTQNLTTTFASGLVDQIVFMARTMGLEASSVSGRGIFNKPHLLTFEGDTADVIRLLRWMGTLS